MLISASAVVWWDFLPELNIGNGGTLMTLLLYANDVLSMANKLLDLAHLRTSGTELRNLDAMAGNLRVKSLEECNKDTVNASFFGVHFGHKIEEQERGGVRYALKSKQYLNNEDYALLHNLQPGNAQFFDFGEMSGPTTQSIWVSAEGFFLYHQLPASWRAAEEVRQPLLGTTGWAWVEIFSNSSFSLSSNKM